MIPAAAIDQQPRTYIGPNETTTLNNVLQKVALFGVLLGSGLLLASFFTGMPLILGAAVTAISAYALHYISNIDSDSETGYPLIEAAQEGDRCMTKFLLLLGANPNIRPNNSALRKAAEGGHAGIVKDLLSAGADPDIKDGHTLETPLMEAVKANQDGVVEILLEHGANPRIRSRYINPANDSIGYALHQQNFFANLGLDHSVVGDQRTRGERQAAADRIVNMLRPYLED